MLLFNPILGYKPNMEGMNTEILDLTPDILLIKENNKKATELAELFQFQYERDWLNGANDFFKKGS